MSALWLFTGEIPAEDCVACDEGYMNPGSLCVDRETDTTKSPSTTTS